MTTVARENRTACHPERYAAKDLASRPQARSFASTLRMTVALFSVLVGTAFASPKTSFNSHGFIQVNGKPFFPIGIYLYELTPDVMKECKAKHFNTIIGNGFRADQLDYIHQNGMMCVPFSGDDYVKAGKDHPALLAWYLVDEPESAGHS